MGILLYQAGEKAEEYIKSKEEGTLGIFLGKLNTYFTIMGVAALVTIGLTILFFIVALIIGISLPHYRF